MSLPVSEARVSYRGFDESILLPLGWAAEGLKRTYPTDHLLDQYTRDTLRLDKTNSVRTWLEEKRKLWTFQIVLVFIDIGFILTKVRQYWLKAFKGRDEGFEDLLQRQMSQMAREEFGMEL